MEIKVGDKVRVSKDAPGLYLRGWGKAVEYNVYAVDGDAAIITYGHQEIAAIPTKYLVKVEEEAKEPKFKVGQFAMFKGQRVEIIGYSEHYPQMYRVFVLTENYHTDAKESDLEPYTEPTEEREFDGITEESANKLSDILEAYGNAMDTIKTDSYWTAYTADLAKEIAIVYAKQKRDVRMAVRAAKSVVEELKKK